MASYYDYKTSKTSEWLRYDKQSGLWLRHRKRAYLYWFKFLQEAEMSDEYDVDWTKYDGWGGANAVLGMKFDDWWSDRWQDLFGVKSAPGDKGNIDKNAVAKYELSTSQYKTEAIRLALLVWQRRNAKSDTKRGNNLAIARAVYQYESGESGEKRARYAETEMSAHALNPDIDGLDDYATEIGGAVGDKQVIQSYIGRYMRQAKRILSAVSVGKFPK